MIYRMDFFIMESPKWLKMVTPQRLCLRHLNSGNFRVGAPIFEEKKLIHTLLHYNKGDSGGSFSPIFIDTSSKGVCFKNKNKGTLPISDQSIR